jgi:hypothetical protein
VFSRKDKGESASTSSSGDYLSNHFSDMRSGASTGGVTASTERKVMQKQKELEKLLMKAESEEISKYCVSFC